jgi:hypothetical protein
MALLRGSDVGDPGGLFTAPIIPAIEFLRQYSDLAGSFAVGARHDAGATLLDAAFADFGASHDFLPGATARFYESNPRSAGIPSSDGIANTDGGPPVPRAPFLIRVAIELSTGENLPPSPRSFFQGRSAIATDIQEVSALATGALSSVSQEGRATGIMSTPDLRALAFPGANRGWADASQASGYFGGASLSLGSSTGPMFGALAWSETPSGAGLLTATPGADPEDVVTSAELEVLDDTALIAISPEGARQEWPASVPQVATLLTEGVSLGVTALERAVRALAEPMLDAGGAPHDVLYWMGVSSWLVAAALAGETVRRRLPQFQTTVPSLFGGPQDPLGGDHA